MNFEISVRRGDGCIVVAVRGECDILTAPLLRERLLELAGQSARMVVDLSGLEFLDCAGLRALLVGRRCVELLGGALVITAPSPPVTRVLQLTGLDRDLTIVPGAETAPDSQAGDRSRALPAARGGAPGTVPVPGQRLQSCDAARRTLSGNSDRQRA